MNTKQRIHTLYKKLNADYCRISTVEDGVYNYEFNFQYFEMDETRLLDTPEFTTNSMHIKIQRKIEKKGVDLQVARNR